MINKNLLSGSMLILEAISMDDIIRYRKYMLLGTAGGTGGAYMYNKFAKNKENNNTVSTLTERKEEKDSNLGNIAAGVGASALVGLGILRGVRRYNENNKSEGNKSDSNNLDTMPSSSKSGLSEREKNWQSILAQRAQNRKLQAERVRERVAAKNKQSAEGDSGKGQSVESNPDSPYHDNIDQAKVFEKLAKGMFN